MKSIVVAYDKNYGIGAENDLLWLRDMPADLKHFKQTTMGGAIIMGRKTFDSIGMPLPGRQNIVVSRAPMIIEGATAVTTLEDAYSAVESNRETYVIGGGQIYNASIDTIDRIIATEVDAEFPQATVFFPAINKDAWQEVSREHHDSDERNKYPYDFVVYERRPSK